MNNDKCPYCGNDSDFIEGKQNGYGAIMFSFFNNRAPIHVVCLNCGTIVRSYVTKVEKLRPKPSKYDL